jgi:hypothetical protein
VAVVSWQGQGIALPLASWPRPGRVPRVNSRRPRGSRRAAVQPWGFDVAEIAIPVGIWHGSHDTRMPRAHSDWLTASIPTAERFDYEGRHVPDDHVYSEILTWLRG